MSLFNAFGCTTQTIVDSFKGSIETDFGGAQLISNEIDLAEAEFIGKLSPKALQMLQSVTYMEVPQIAQISGANIWTANPPVLQDFYCWAVPRFNPALNNTVYAPIPPINGTGACGSEAGCDGNKIELNQLYLNSDYTISGSRVTFGPTFDQDTHTYYVSYTVDTSTLNLPSMKAMIRDRVACVLGMQLYSKGDDTWKLVDLYCTRADRWLESVDEHFLPSEFKKYKWLNNPFTVAGGIKTIRISRS